MESKDQAKKLAGLEAVRYLKQDMTLGIGTGSTVYWFIEELGKKIADGYACRCVPTSSVTEKMAASLKIPLFSLNDVERIDLTIDGADEIDPQLNLIKGGGGALLQEKMVAAASEKLIIIADDSKLVKQLGSFPLPVEVIPFGWKQVQARLAKNEGVSSTLRLRDGEPFLTDHGHYILDCHFHSIKDPAELTVRLNMIPGVVENGLFINMASMAIIASADGTIKKLEGDK